jgi:hypothetical protein
MCKVAMKVAEEVWLLEVSHSRLQSLLKDIKYLDFHE